ncbi:hypothetical protein CDD80_57 [Ophiocordyceps camponoti-rufipedis]|uniref:Uncharacterized protein n=1 Tax=Ophiocordyceps camponoti-rufipedis TaxID=2004952 RepID=A0A2C5ZN41_9HYPO|nr:hypothetical protein CDD80_57 [Ophiocordyceps camponoti-rufipedis]
MREPHGEPHDGDDTISLPRLIDDDDDDDDDRMSPAFWTPYVRKTTTHARPRRRQTPKEDPQGRKTPLQEVLLRKLPASRGSADSATASQPAASPQHPASRDGGCCNLQDGRPSVLPVHPSRLPNGPDSGLNFFTNLGPIRQRIRPSVMRLDFLRDRDRPWTDKGASSCLHEPLHLLNLGGESGASSAPESCLVYAVTRWEKFPHCPTVDGVMP